MNIIDQIYTLISTDVSNYTISKECNDNISRITCSPNIYEGHSRFPNSFHNVLFDSLIDIGFEEICTSDDVGDTEITGDYSYNIYNNPQLQYWALWLESSHPFVYPHRLWIFDMHYQINIEASSSCITIGEGFDNIDISNPSEVRAWFIYILQHSDRPSIIDEIG